MPFEFHKVVNGYHFRFQCINDLKHWYNLHGIEIKNQLEIPNQVYIGTYSICCKEPEELIIPKIVEYEGIIYNVVAISDISHLSYVKKIYIPNSIVYILYISDNKNLEYIKFEDNSKLKVINSLECPFNNNPKLKHVYFPNSLLSISNCSFQNCDSLKYYRIPGNCNIKDYLETYIDVEYDDIKDNVIYIVYGNIIIKQTIKNKFYYCNILCTN